MNAVQRTPRPWVLLGEAEAASIRLELATEDEANAAASLLQRFGFLCAVLAKATGATS